MFIDKAERPAGEVKVRSPVYNKAADLIEEKGHAKMQFVGSQGELCTIAAVATAQGLYERSYLNTAFVKLDNWTRENYSVGACNYNNTHTKEEVVSMLRKAAVEIS